MMAAGVTQATGGKASKSFKKQTAGLAAFSGIAKGLTDYNKLRDSQRRIPKKKKKK